MTPAIGDKLGESLQPAKRGYKNTSGLRLQMVYTQKLYASLMLPYPFRKYDSLKPEII